MPRKPFLFATGFGLALLALVGAGCSKTYERQVFESPCGDGKLTLTLHVTTHPPAANDVKMWLVYDTGGHRRNVDVLKPRIKIYALPTPAERYARLRPGADDWPVYVNPNIFTSAEYQMIRSRLQAELPAIDTALAAEKLGESLDYGNLARLSSTRYVDYESFRHVYAGAREGVTVDLFPDGQIWCRHPQGMTLVGSVVERGHQAILADGYAAMTKSGIPNLVDYVLSCRDAQGRTIATEFEVQRVTNKEYDAAMQRERADRSTWP